MAMTVRLQLITLIPALAGLVLPVRGQVSELQQDVGISLQNVPSMGEKTARLTMVEFGDYQCPLCSQYFNLTLRQLVEKYIKTGKVKYAFRDYPLESIHPMALKAAEAARCAGEQGKYWEMHDRLLRNQASIEHKVLPLHAQMLGLNIPHFEQCLDNGKYTGTVRDSIAEGKKAGVRGTPWFFLGFAEPDEPRLRPLIYIEGAQPYAVFKEAIEKLLTRASSAER